MLLTTNEVEAVNHYVAIQNEPVEQSSGSSVCKDYTQKYCSCVLYLRSQKGLNIFGDAITQKPTHTKNPKRGDVIIFRYTNGQAHVAFIEGILPSGLIYISEWNYYEGEYSERSIDPTDPSIYGFIRPSIRVEPT